MKVPENIENIIKRILESEDNWKALYMASWGVVIHWLEPAYKNTKCWKEPIRLGLPASVKGYCQYTPEQLVGILKKKDYEFTLGHLQTLFSLFEELLRETSKVLIGEEIEEIHKWPNMKGFFEDPLINCIISDNELKELHLAKETRNCYIHRDSKVDSDWLNVYKEARGQENPWVSSGNEFVNAFGKQTETDAPLFHQIEKWNDFIVEITKRIREKIVQK